LIELTPELASAMMNVFALRQLAEPSRRWPLTIRDAAIERLVHGAPAVVRKRQAGLTRWQRQKLRNLKKRAKRT